MSGKAAEVVARDCTKGSRYLPHTDKTKIAAHEHADLSRGPDVGLRPVMVIVQQSGRHDSKPLRAIILYYFRSLMDRLMMRYFPLLLLAIGCAVPAGSLLRQAPPAQKLIRDFVFVPAGTEGDSVLPEFYISAIEVTNRQYRDFIHDLEDSGATEQLRIAMVDTLDWAKTRPAHPALAHFYFQNRAYDDYPVVNVSRPAAELYCMWLTANFNRYSRQKARFSLPTEAQWTYAARGGNPNAIYPWPGNSVTYNKKGKLKGMKLCNFRMDTIMPAAGPGPLPDTAAIIMPSLSYGPNTYGIYNMGGNAAEMIAGENYTKGGSYCSPAAKVLIAAHEDADLSHGAPTIGFRPVMVYLH